MAAMGGYHKRKKPTPIVPAPCDDTRLGDLRQWILLTYVFTLGVLTNLIVVLALLKAYA